MLDCPGPRQGAEPRHEVVQIVGMAIGEKDPVPGLDPQSADRAAGISTPLAARRRRTDMHGRRAYAAASERSAQLAF
jgi:hypothetical protein